MLTQVLIVHSQLAFAVLLKQGLERTNLYEAHPFVSADAAFDYLRDHVQDIALVDFAIPDMSGESIVAELRKIQPDIAVIATPRQQDETIESLNLQASIDTPFNARDVIAISKAVFNDLPRPSAGEKAGLLNRLAAATSTRVEVPRPPEAKKPEPSSLNDVLASMGDDIFEPEAPEGSTPVTAPDDSAALWQVDYRESGLFDEVLDSLPRQAEDQERKGDPFDELVNSMRSGQPHQPLPARRQEYVEFVFKGGLDEMLDQMDRVAQMAGDAEPDEESRRTFDKLAQEEPPPPPLEESGTVGDLISGVNDASFREVLSVLRGEEQAEAPPPEPRPKRAAPKSTPSQEFDFDIEADEPDTPAKLILKQAFDQALAQESFSLDELLANIEQQLPRHRPKVQPLPSWIRESRERGDKRFLTTEPEFLRDVMPEGRPSEDTIPHAPAGVTSEDYNSAFIEQLTQPSRAQRLEAPPDETEWIDAEEQFAAETLHYVPVEDVLSAVSSVAEEAAEAEPVDWELEAAAADEEVDEAEWFGAPTVEELPIEAAPVVDPWEDDFAAVPHYEDTQQLAVSDVEVPEPYIPVVPELPREPAPPEYLPEFPELETENFNTEFELLAAFEVVEDRTPVAERADAPVVQMPRMLSAAADDPRIAQLALNLTEASLELTAEATMLTRGDELVAYAGQMADDEIDDLRQFIPSDAEAMPAGSHIRFVSAPESGRDYMLYSVRTEDDLILSLVFAAATPLRDIRRQGQRLAAALTTVPEPPMEPTEPLQPPPAVAVEPAVVSPYAFVWLLNDPLAALEPAVAQAITTGLRVQLNERGWRIHDLQVNEDYVYLLADVPGDALPYEVIADLKVRSARIAGQQNPAYDVEALWTDGYLVVAPGRPLDIDEIQQFINFERME